MTFYQLRIGALSTVSMLLRLTLSRPLGMPQSKIGPASHSLRMHLPLLLLINYLPFGIVLMPPLITLGPWKHCG